jgi:acyl-CoA hydrolase
VLGSVSIGAVRVNAAWQVAGREYLRNDIIPPQMKELSEQIDFFAPRLVLRPQEISNNPAVVRQLGVIAINTALEVDLYGHVNSTHVGGCRMMNGIGGSGDFARNAYLSIFVCPSIAKSGCISTVVPMCTHVDHNEHTVQAIATEHGLADLRGLAPKARAQKIIDQCGGRVHCSAKAMIASTAAQS